MSALGIRNFSHVCVSVSDVERSLAFYRDVLGLQLIFDVQLDGAGMERATGESGARGRMVGCKVPGSGVTIELLGFAQRAGAKPTRPGPFGYTNIALSVDNLDAAHAALAARGIASLQAPIELGGVRMFFLTDPDGTAIEIIQFPRGATTSAQHNGA